MVRRHLIAFSLFLSSFAFGQTEVQTEPEPSNLPQNWFAVTLGLTSLDAQIGWYNLGGSPLEGRLSASYAFPGAYLLAAELLGLTKERSGFYGGGGLGVIADGSFDLVLAGPQLLLGGDIPLNEQSGILIENSLGVYPLFLVDRRTPEEQLSMLFPLFFRLGVGYRYSF